jgi:hypothetical protein
MHLRRGQDNGFQWCVTFKYLYFVLWTFASMLWNAKYANIAKYVLEYYSFGINVILYQCRFKDIM